MSNLARIRTELKDAALLVTNIINIRWLTGFTGSSGFALVTPDRAIFITDSRYTLQAQAEVSGFEVVIFQRPVTADDVIAETLRALQIKNVGFEPSLTYGAWKQRVEKYPEFEWVESADIIAELRKVKTDDEIRRIKAACQLADACIAHITGLIQAGRTEYEIGLDIEFFYRRHGATNSFEPIVASGPNSAKPHARPSDRILERGDFVTIDCGGKLDGYCSDITRTFVIGEATERHREIYNQVLRAEVECCAALKAGANGQDIDTHARTVLAERDLAQYFGHGLGHGLGLDVHDPGGLSPNNNQLIEPGMVFTVEPGVYIKGFGGVRIEDDVLVTSGDPEILTQAPKELLIL
jgi:Xaa-Pro aminopeptidase